MATTSHDKAANEAANAPTHLTPENGTVHLPEGIDVSACEMTREGSSLVLTAPDGQTFVIDSYFATLDSPVIMAANGSMLSPQLVQSFITTAGDVQVAANNQISDKSPVGEVSETSGNASVTHADGTHEKITTGTQIFEGDVIETDAKGAVNIKFADDSTFAVSENARMSVDDFSFNPSDQSGTTGLSILRGVFMFTSGLVGRENPDAVHLNTPVGSIGIRGTIIGGHIGEDGHSQISVLEGAIVVRNGTGEQILSDQFATVQLTGFNAPISSIGTLDAGSISKSYGAVRSVSPTLFTSIDDAAHDTAKPDAKAPDAKGDAQPETQDAKPDAGKAEPAGDAQPQSQDTRAQADTTAAATETAPAAETTTATTTSAAATTTTVFQTLQTGSNIDSGLGAAQASSAPATTIVTPTPIVVASTPAPAAPVQTTTQTAQTHTEQQFDTRPPASAIFATGGAVAEESGAGTLVGTIGMSASLPFPVTYSLVSNPGNLFAINAATGVVTLTGTAGDSEQGITHHDLVVRITRTETSQFVDTPLSVGVLPVDEAPHFNNLTGITVAEGGSVTLTSALVGATDPEGRQLTYTIADISKGQVLVNGTAATSFTQTQLDAGLVTYAHDGSEPGGAGLQLTVADAAGNTAGTLLNAVVNVTPVNDAPVSTVSTGGTLAENASTTVSINNLNWTDSDNNPSEIVYNITSIANGSVQKMTPIIISDLNGGQSSTSLMWISKSVNQTFTQQDINDGLIRFTQNGSESTNANFTYTVSDGIAAAQTGTYGYNITPVNDAPTLTRNQGSFVSEGGVTILDSTQLHYGDFDNSSSQLTYTISTSSNGTLEKLVGGVWTTSTSFTQAEINNGLVRFHQNGNEASTANFSYTLLDPSGAGGGGNFNFTVTPVNDAPTGVSLLASNTFTERSGTVASTVVAQISVADAEPITNLSNSSFVVQSYKNNAWSTDTRFSTVLESGQWVIKSNANQTFNYEVEPSIKLRVALTDAGVTINSPEVTLNVVDVNETATTFKLNGGLKYSLGFDALVQGHTSGAIIGVLNATDSDTNTNFQPKAANYKVTATTGSSLSVDDFEIIDVTNQNGVMTQVLKVKTGVTNIFSGDENAFSVTVALDAAMNGFSGGDDMETVFRFVGRNDTLTALSIGGNTGLRLDNNIFADGSQLGASAAAGDFNGDGQIDVAFGAPKAANTEATPEAAGAVYAYGGPNSSFIGSFIKHLETTNNDTGQMYGASIVSLEHFDTTKGAELAITNPGAGYVDIVHNSDKTSVTTLTNIATGTASTTTTGKEITIASIGDINNDGLTDLLVGMPYSDVGFTDKGQAYVVLGGLDVGTFDITNLGSHGFLLPGYLDGQTEGNFGMAATGIGDYNGDGISDFAVSASNYDSNGVTAGSGQGKVNIYFGSSSASSELYATSNPNSPSSIAFAGAVDGGHFGAQIAAAGDINQDGLDDIIIRESGGTNGGALYVNLGVDTTGLTGTLPYHSFSITGTSSVLLTETFGSAGDFNGDGFDDIYVDTMTATAGGLYQHTMVILYGGSLSSDINIADAMNDPDQSFKIRFLAPTGAHLTATAAGDYNGDGFDDLVISDPTTRGSSTALNDGQAFLVYGSNYDDIANRFTVDNTADRDFEYYVGSTGNNILNDGGYAALSFNGGAGNDAFVISKNNAIYTFNGGTGNDTIKLFFSEGETTASADTINLEGIGNNVKGVETIEFASGSKNDTLVLDIKDILSMTSTSDTHQLIIKALDDPATLSANQNYLSIVNGSQCGTDLAAHGFTCDANQDGQTDRANLRGNQDAYVYTNTSTGAQLIVDSRIAGADALITSCLA